VFKIIRYSYRVAGVTLALLGLFQASAVAGIYKWKDDQGKLHFTDDRGKIPQKYSGQTEKFKGVTEPKVEVEEPESESETSSSEKGANNTEEASVPAEESKTEEPEPLDPETIEALKTARGYLEDENFAYLGVFQHPFDPARSRKYIKTIKSMIEKKIKTIKQLKGFELKSIKKTRAYLRRSLVLDRGLEETEDVDFLKTLRGKVLKDADKKKGLIKKLLDDYPPGVDKKESDEALTNRIFQNK
jgi:hypothetical protein